MKALAYDRFGGIDVLRIADLPRPKPAPGEVLVAMRASSINVIDSRVRNGAMGLLVRKTFPKVPGADIAGVVVEPALGVEGLTVGDEVFGAVDPMKGGAFAEYVSVDAGQLAIKHPSLSFEEAAAVPIAGLAALSAMRDLGRVEHGAKVLIHGASGAVGLFAIQIAKRLGAHVVAVAGTSGVDAAWAAGADQVIDYRKQDGQTFETTFDVIFDASGRMPFRIGRTYLTGRGVLIEPSPTIPLVIGAAIANRFRTTRHRMLMTKPRRGDLDVLSKMVGDGVLTPTIAETFPLSEARQAFARMEKGGTVGKLIVTIP